MLPNQISEQWEILWPAIEASLPPTGGAGDTEVNNILEALLAGRMQAWISKREGRVMALVTTAFVEDIGTKVRNLLIYSIYGYGPITDTLVKEGIMTLRKFAVRCGCKNIIAYTNVKRIIDMFEDIGGAADSVFLSMSVNGELKDENIYQG